MSEKISPITQKALDHIQELSEAVEEMAQVQHKVLISDELGTSLTSRDKTVVLEALALHIAITSDAIKAQQSAIDNGSESGNLESHDEKSILEGCVAMMQNVGERVNEWLEYWGIWSDDDEEYLDLDWHYSEIVKRLFLWNTTHSGGTSTYAKCRELGVDPCDTVTIRISNSEEENAT